MGVGKERWPRSMARDDKLVRGDDARLQALLYLHHARNHVVQIDSALRGDDVDEALLNLKDAIADLYWCRRYARRVRE